MFFETLFKSGSVVKKIFTLLGVAVVIAGILFLSQTPFVSRLGVQLVEGQYLSARVLSYTLFGLSPKTLAVQGDLGDYAHSGNTTAVIVKDPATNVQQVLLLKPEKKTLTTDATGKAALALSKKGDLLAYASLTNAKEGALFSPFLAHWTITLVNLKSGEVSTLGKGFAPQFFTKGGKELLLFTAPTGVTVVDMQAHVSNTTFFMNPGAIDYAARVSENGEYIAIPNGLTKHYDVFLFTRVAAPLGITPIGQIPELLSFATFKGTTLYAIDRSEKGGAQLVAYNPKNLKRTLIDTLPTDSFYRIIH